MARTLALRSGVPEFKTRSDLSLSLFLIVPGSTFRVLVNRQLVCLWPVGILTVVVAVWFRRCVDCFIGSEKPLWVVVNLVCIVLYFIVLLF